MRPHGTQSEPAAAIEYVGLPDQMPADGTTSCYDAKGKTDCSGSVLISTYGVQFIWARFLEPVKPGQVPKMVFTTMPQLAVVIDGAATEWDTAVSQPTIGDAVVELMAVERGAGTCRVVCRNT